MAKKHNRRSASGFPTASYAAAPKTTHIKSIQYNMLQRALINRALSQELTRNASTISRNLTRDVIDRRRFHPDRVKPAGPLKRKYARLVDAHPFGTGFAVPQRVAICARRKIRREILHAFKHTGAGARRKKRNRNYWSDVKC